MEDGEGGLDGEFGVLVRCGRCACGSVVSPIM